MLWWSLTKLRFSPGAHTGAKTTLGSRTTPARGWRESMVRSSLRSAACTANFPRNCLPFDWQNPYFRYLPIWQWLHFANDINEELVSFQMLCSNFKSWLDLLQILDKLKFVLKLGAISKQAQVFPIDTVLGVINNSKSNIGPETEPWSTLKNRMAQRI